MSVPLETGWSCLRTLGGNDERNQRVTIAVSDGSASRRFECPPPTTTALPCGRETLRVGYQRGSAAGVNLEGLLIAKSSDTFATPGDRKSLCDNDLDRTAQSLRTDGQATPAR